jgi:hypothetical protein
VPDRRITRRRQIPTVRGASRQQAIPGKAAGHLLAAHSVSNGGAGTQSTVRMRTLTAVHGGATLASTRTPICPFQGRQPPKQASSRSKASPSDASANDRPSLNLTAWVGATPEPLRRANTTQRPATGTSSHSQQAAAVADRPGAAGGTPTTSVVISTRSHNPPFLSS